MFTETDILFAMAVRRKVELPGSMGVFRQRSPAAPEWNHPGDCKSS